MTITTLNKNWYIKSLNEKKQQEHEESVRKETERKLNLDNIQAQLKVDYFNGDNSLICDVQSIIDIAHEIHCKTNENFRDLRWDKNGKPIIRAITFGELESSRLNAIMLIDSNSYDGSYANPDLMIDRNGNIVNLYHPKTIEGYRHPFGYNEELLNIFKTTLEDFNNKFKEIALRQI